MNKAIKQAGFTLIELMVGLAIIAVLATAGTFAHGSGGGAGRQAQSAVGR